MIKTEAATQGWRGRALGEALELLRKRCIRDLWIFMRSKFWRAALRLEGGRLLPQLRRFSSSNRAAAIVALDAVLEKELSMRLLLRETAPWLATLDQHPAPLIAPAVLLRIARTSSDDAAWLRRCPNIVISEVPGGHQTLFEPENVTSLRQAFLAATSVWS